jgi:hypothetical protein
MPIVPIFADKSEQLATGMEVRPLLAWKWATKDPETV